MAHELVNLNSDEGLLPVMNRLCREMNRATLPTMKQTILANIDRTTAQKAAYFGWALKAVGKALELQAETLDKEMLRDLLSSAYLAALVGVFISDAVAAGPEASTPGPLAN